MSHTGFSSSTGIGGGERDYNPTSTDLDQQPAGDTGNLGGGIGDRTQGAGRFGADDVENLSTGDQYGSSGGYVPLDGQGPPEGAVQKEEGDVERAGFEARGAI